jgi:polyisoprenoid-binding protein YceI
VVGKHLNFQHNPKIPVCPQYACVVNFAHFDQKFPHATLKGTFQDSDKVDYSKDGEYDVTVSGTISIKGVEKEVSEKGTIAVSGDSLSLNSEFNLTLADYGIAFKKGKPAKNIAKSVKITIDAKSLKAEESKGA